MQTEFLKTKHTKITACNDNHNSFGFYVRVLKPLIDKFIAFFLLVLLSPLFLIIALLIKFESKGTIFFRQSRVGLNGEDFFMFKFRSMTVTENGDDVKLATVNDARITRIGSFIRKTSIDELPQLFNVLLGDMSLVGPRPHATKIDREYAARINEYPKRHIVLPGITGLAQIKGYRGPTDTHEQLLGRVQYDIIYTKNISLWADLKILFKTAFIVFNDKKAF